MDSVINILDFPNELLIEIFTYLLPSDRRVASECCKRFLEIWLLDDFIEDRRLVFDECLLDSESEPGSVFLQSTRKYDKIVLEHVDIGENINELWEKWGETVTSIEKGMKFAGSIDWFAFKKLKDIKVTNEQQINDPHNVPNGLDRIVLTWKDLHNEEERNKLAHLHFSAKSIEIDNFNNFIEDELWYFIHNHQSQIEKVSIESYYITSLLDNQNLKNLKHLITNYHGGASGNLEEILENLEERFPKMEHLELTTHYDLPATNLTCLKTLTAKNIPLAQLTRLNLFVNLETLDLTLDGYASETTCFFTYDKFHNTNLKELKIHRYGSDLLCDTCFENLTLAFPKLEDLECGLLMSNQNLKHLQKNSPKLKRLYLLRSKEILSFAPLPNLHELELYGVVDPDLTSWPMMPNLRKLTIQFDTITSRTVKMFEKMPYLEHLEFSYFKIGDDVYELINEMTKPLKRLRTLKFVCTTCFNNLETEIIDKLAQNCKYLRTIHLGTINFRSESEKNILEEMMAKYWWIRSIDGTPAYRPEAGVDEDDEDDEDFLGLFFDLN